VNDRFDRALDDARRRWVPDPRLGVFDVALEPDRRRIVGATTSRDALGVLRRLAADAGLDAGVELLPNASVGTDAAAVVTAAVAPLAAEPRAALPRVNEVLHGEQLEVLERRGAWLRVRSADGYHAWLHSGYVATGPEDWADDWSTRATAWSLGAELRFREGGARLRVPLGARLAPRRHGRVEAADGRIGTLAGGVLRPAAEAGAEARLVAAPEWAQRWLGGAPYAWGGRTEWGVDCSGLAQVTFAVRGTPLPRDADLQFDAGHAVALASDGRGYEAGDLLFFAEGGRVAHVALWAGAGTIVHAALARGGVATDDLFGDSPLAGTLRAGLVGVRRV
jgi:gamma-D-glutamyl-L-lysine dipeptidyl-peptidase